MSAAKPRPKRRGVASAMQSQTAAVQDNLRALRQRLVDKRNRKVTP